MTKLAGDWEALGKEVFQYYDADNDGLLTESEARELLRGLGLNATDYQINEMLCTATGSARQAVIKIDFAAFQGLVDRIQSEGLGRHDTQQDIVAALSEFDKDKSGKLSVETVREALTTLGESMTAAEVDDLVAIADSHNTGFVDIQALASLCFSEDS